MSTQNSLEKVLTSDDFLWILSLNVSTRQSLIDYPILISYTGLFKQK